MDKERRPFSLLSRCADPPCGSSRLTVTTGRAESVALPPPQKSKNSGLLQQKKLYLKIFFFFTDMGA